MRMEYISASITPNYVQHLCRKISTCFSHDKKRRRMWCATLGPQAPFTSTTIGSATCGCLLRVNVNVNAVYDSEPDILATATTAMSMFARLPKRVCLPRPTRSARQFATSSSRRSDALFVVRGLFLHLRSTTWKAHTNDILAPGYYLQ